MNRHTSELLMLAPRPALAARVLRIAARDNGSAVDIARVVQADPSLTARVLWLANSPFYGMSGHVASARHAVLVLGLDLANAVAVSAAFAVLDAPGDTAGEQPWRHAIATACAAAIVAPKVGVSGAEAFSAGLLHDVGATVLARRDAEAFAAAMASPSMADQVAKEIASFGATHAEEGARLLESWAFPSRFVEAVALHQHGVEAPRHALGLVLRVAEAIALDREPMAAYPTARDIERLLLACRLQPDDLAPITHQVAERIRYLEGSLGTARPLVPSRDDVRRYLATACSQALERVDATRFDPATYRQFAFDVVTLLGQDADVAPIAGLMSGGVRSAATADRERRVSARVDASVLATTLTDDDVFAGLTNLVQQLAVFPAAVAADLVVEDAAALGPPFHGRAGFWDDDGTAYVLERFAVDGPGERRIIARLRVANGATTDEAAVELVLHELARSLERVAHARAFESDTEIEPITGLGNRSRLQRTLTTALDRATRSWERVAVLLLDLEGYKRVNDEWGEEVGDAVLRTCATALRVSSGPHAECIRLDGSEFVVVAPVSDVLDALRIAEDVRAEVAQRCYEVVPGEWGLTATVGVAVAPDAGKEPESLLRAADVALFRAKAADRDGIMVAEPAEDATPGPSPRSFLTAPEE